MKARSPFVLLVVSAVVYLMASWTLAPYKEAYRLLDTSEFVYQVPYRIWGQGEYLLQERGAFRCPWGVMGPCHEIRGVNISRPPEPLEGPDVWEDEDLMRWVTSLTLPMGN